ncbi:hypothetical protein Tco_1059392 [Tanacetum coccineum]
MEDEFYNLAVKGNDLKTYVRRFQELAVLCPNMVPNTEKLMEVFIGGLPRSIKGNVTASKPQTLEEAITITQRLMEQNYMSNLVNDVLLREFLYIKDCERLRNMYLSFHHEFISMEHEHEVWNLDSTGMRASQSRQHESRKLPTKSLFDVDSSRISIIIVNTKEHHSDVLAVSQG